MIKCRMGRFVILLCLLLAGQTTMAQLMGGDFKVDASLQEEEGGKLVVVEIGIPPDHYIYADKLAVAAEKTTLEPADIPQAKEKYDQYLEKEIEVYDQTTVFKYRIAAPTEEPIALTVNYQGCGPNICFPPASAEFSLGGATEEKDAPPTAKQSGTEKPASELANRLDDFTVAGKASGYLDTDRFIAFLDDPQSGGSDLFAGQGILVVVLLILAGGFALNLTPCVLPMIPVNISIIGAGAQAKSKARGFLLGGTYGLGIALAYGVLGLLVVLTGARFGALNSSPWFNFGIAILFAILSLSMFGVFNLDFSRFQSGTGTPSRGGPFITAFILGLVAALLAGACVAPVVISVLLYSATLYADGRLAGLFLPFLLGIGMALPWPFAGAGLSFLPKSGAWMEKVKYVFGVIILLAALYYGNLGFSLLDSGTTEEVPAAPAQTDENADKDEWLTSLSEALDQAQEQSKPIFIDFWAKWCKSCLKMDKTTFRNAEVRSRMEDYVKLKIDGDQKDPATKLAMDRFVEVGLPTYVILEPQDEE